MVNTLLASYVALTETFGLVATWLLLIYAGALGALAVSLLSFCVQTWFMATRRWLHARRERQRTARELDARDRLTRILQASHRGTDHAA